MQPRSEGPGIALRDYAIAELTMAIEALATRGSRVHAAIHQARKAVRRTRAVLALGNAALGPGTQLIDRQLRRVNRRLSPLRDAHALVQTLDRLGIKARDRSTKTALARASRIATRRRATLSRTSQFAHALTHAQAVLATLRAALEGLPWASLRESTVTDAMQSAETKAEAARERAYRHDAAEDWHAWRRSMRRISQQRRALEAMALLAPGSLFDKSLTEQLGVMQDLSLLSAFCGNDSPFPDDRVALRRFAEATLARQRKRIRSLGGATRQSQVVTVSRA